MLIARRVYHSLLCMNATSLSSQVSKSEVHTAHIVKMSLLYIKKISKYQLSIILLLANACVRSIVQLSGKISIILFRC